MSGELPPSGVDLAVITGLYLGVVGLFRLAFVGFTTANVAVLDSCWPPCTAALIPAIVSL